MGAESFIIKEKGRSIGEVFDRLVEESIYDNGHDAYSGSISTCSLGRCVKSFDTYDKDNEIVARHIIKEKDNGVKWRADYIDLGVCGYEEVTVTKEKQKVDAVTETRYGVFDEVCEKLVHRDAHFATAKEAEAFAQEWAKKGEECNIKKYKRKISGNDISTKFKVTVKQVDKMPKRKKKGVEVYPIHKYMIYGWAAS